MLGKMTIPSEVCIPNGRLIEVEEGVGCPPGNGVEGVYKVARTALFITVVFPSCIHPVDHFIHGITSLVITPISVNEATKTHGYGPEIILEGSVV